ncbi:MAG: sigma-70 family RNA polymerase sigma factor [Flavobacteriales bacterium]|nr:sigma-70 family RNA polymerase sigma factor [Flavobacteriales bacterium]
MSSTKQTEFMQAYAKCHAPFLRYCSVLAYGKMEVEDLVQDVLLAAFTHWEGIAKKDDLLFYLMRAARNRAISEWRVKRRSEALCDKHATRLRARGATAEMLVDVRIVYDALEQLPTTQREALVLFEIAGLPMADIAAIQKSSAGSVKTTVSRARARVRAILSGRARSVHTEVLHAFKTFLL